jgi:hypothetical protein
MITDLQNKLNQSAVIVRKYNLGDKIYFFSKFSSVDKSRLDTAWTFAENKIQNREIIKNASNLSAEEASLAILKSKAFNNNTIHLFKKLNSKFDVKELKLKDENIERKVRNILALRFLLNISNEINEYRTDEVKSIKSKFLKLISKIKYGIIAMFIIGVFIAPSIIEGLTLPENLLNEYLHSKYPSIKSSAIEVDVLAAYLYEESKYKFNGAICNDGWKSHSQGRGTCSHHQGVAYYFYEGDFSKSFEECKEDAIIEINEFRKKAFANSWRD